MAPRSSDPLLSLFPKLRQHIWRIFDAFGPPLWETHYSRLASPYRDAFRVFTEALDFLSADDRVWSMGRATAVWIGWRCEIRARLSPPHPVAVLSLIHREEPPGALTPFRV